MAKKSILRPVRRVLAAPIVRVAKSIGFPKRRKRAVTLTKPPKRRVVSSKRRKRQ